MTVSLALRDDNRIAKQTRMAVHLEAKKQGYVSNPLIGAYMAGVRRGQVPGHSPSIAYISGAEAGIHSKTPHLIQLLQGVRQRARALGFRLLEFFGAGTDLDWDRLSRDLEKSRSVGLILAPFPPLAPEIRLAWSRFCNVAVGYSAKRPAMHTVTDEKLKVCRTLLAGLENDGFSRIGFVSFQEHEVLHSHGLVAAFIEWQQGIEASSRIPLLRLKEIGEHKRLWNWMQKYNPTVVMSPLDISSAITSPEKGRARFVPLCMSRSQNKPHPAHGSIEPNKEVGTAAVDMLAGLIYRHEAGLPEKACVVEVPGILCGYARRKNIAVLP